MPASTQTSNPVFGETDGLHAVPPERLNPQWKGERGPSGLCSRCSDTIFSPIVWAHLLGETLTDAHPEDGADYHINFSSLDKVLLNTSGWDTKSGIPGIFLFKMFNSRPSPRHRGPMVDIRMPPQDHTLPIRLLDLAGFEDSETVRLVESNDLVDAGDSVSCVSNSTAFPPRSRLRNTLKTTLSKATRSQKIAEPSVHGSQKPRYAVLSYVWGTHDTKRLIQTNLEDFGHSIAVIDLPQTILDAISLTSALGIRYLWVDSLCILQDSSPDKDLQIPRMSQYYHNAAVVISASGSIDVRMGFLRLPVVNRKVDTEGGPMNLERTPFRIPVHLPDRSVQMLVDAMPMMYNYSREPINKRAWTLQESILPRRLITIPQSGGISMQCLEGESLAGHIVSDPYREMEAFSSPGFMSAGANKTLSELSGVWCGMVQQYTHRSLSFRSDILVAMGAIARVFSAQYMDVMGKYVAGLWHSDLRSGLLWHITSTQPSKPLEQRGYIAPSWSWAASPYPVHFRNTPEIFLPGGDFSNSESYKSMFETRWYCKVISCDVTLRSEADPFGAVTSGVLTVRGPLTALQPTKGRRDRLRDNTEKPSVNGPKPNTEQRVKVMFDSNGFPILHPEESMGTSGQEPLILDNIVSNPDNFVYDTAKPWFWFAVWYAGRGRARGLILEKLSTGDYKRIGFAEYMVDQKHHAEADSHQEQVIRIL
ncbi:hypothetical protein LTR62_007139 [Meristemomyces frigidus]|uniref:Heterokaryon incompatibility domain-containing protein n=1 Tax=Meristemomyces frigidus TaxID=1508187 RepID=A0AAN7TBT1_9PEZI|nr:hypothetical protein LTR62_007139 [Meristemomyces frigidus]